LPSGGKDFMRSFDIDKSEGPRARLRGDGSCLRSL
jgi:hypothetical protein